MVACVPYDVVDSAEAAELAADNPYSLLHVDRAEINLPNGTDPHSDAVYESAREWFSKLQSDGALVRETAPALYLYRLTMDGRSQSGFAVVCHMEDYENDIIRKHEKTRRDKEDDRTRLIGTIAANTGPVFLTYRDTEALDALAASTQEREPLYQFTAPDGIGHAVWRVEAPDEVVQAFAEVPVSYVADGHHRTASAVRVGRERRAANLAHDGTEDYNWFLCVLFPATQLHILPYNRVVADLNGLSREEFLNRVSESFRVSETAEPAPDQPGRVCMYLPGQWYRIEWDRDSAADPVSGLDVSVLQDRLLNPLLGIADPRTSQRIEFVGGIRGTQALSDRVDAGKGGVAFSMFPVTVDELMAIADAGQIMPPKSTWFEPKLRSGLFVHTF